MVKSDKKSRRLKPTPDTRMTLIVPSDLVAKLDAVAEELSKELSKDFPGKKFTRSDVARQALHQFVDEKNKET